MINFYIRFIFSADDLNFKLDSFDFNDSFVVKYLIIENEINTILNDDTRNFIYKNFLISAILFLILIIVATNLL